MVKGILKGLSVTWKRFWETYTDDISWSGARQKTLQLTEEGIEAPLEQGQKGIFTVQYPEEQLIQPEEARYVPFLVYDEGDDGKSEVALHLMRHLREGLPAAMHLDRAHERPQTGRPVPEPTEFYIDMDICMNCGFCAEYCPFDAIKMDHDFDIASYGRNVYNLDKLLKPSEYYKSIRPEL
jgi:NADH-quinone oxidoreductase subunit I